MDVTKIAVIADIHGNRWALEAVLQDMERRGVTQIMNLGDSVNGPLDPAGTADILLERNIPSICGNDDRVLWESVAATGTRAYVQAQLTERHYNWLRVLPATATIGEEILACHGTPDSDTTYLLETVTPTGVVLRSGVEIARELADVQYALVLCGHSHIARVVSVADGQFVVNPGSVGLQAYTHDDPVDHYMEAGSPHARYAIVHATPHEWSVEQVMVAYDWQAAAAVAEHLQRADWARWIVTGRV